ncbi:hypothetical protein OG2516_02519 [Oceanicola granulosus HTCC2516]|uniref:DUF6456 domain-containing protein n=1 Tax=Oceanicola granulosus (strain ATCC BAA-861 / DSM 15982 / KCTC 12143 / HTCC2516) TaxID=314256 RepID=Q2CHM0_OCEGH|nr:hypothetical protein OG2516_02519 [Oceanicola granulosus HTCC2516]
MPPWVPAAAAHYLAHVERGTPIRALARRVDVHASTVLRQVRRVERRRDDPLVDAALKRLSAALPDPVDGSGGGSGTSAPLPAAETVEDETIRVLRRLVEPGAVLAVARDMEMAVVVRESAGGAADRTALVARESAQVLALNEWIESDEPAARIARYRITGAGRTALRELIAGRENARATGEPAPAVTGRRTARPAPRAALAESPLAGLARRRDRDGRPFLPRELVAAGERLREDFELGQVGERLGQSWDGLLTGRVDGGAAAGGQGASSAAARERVEAALADLGPGLGDVALRCCCLLEGLEETERRMGWSARSGKIVLRIALQRLRRHYDEQGSCAMIG